METLALRINQHCKNAQAVVDFLRTRKEIKRIIHPSQQQGVHRERADRYLKGQFGGLVGFELAGGKEAGRKFIDSLQLHYHADQNGIQRKNVPGRDPQKPVEVKRMQSDLVRPLPPVYRRWI